MRARQLTMICVVILATSVAQLQGSAIMQRTSAVEWDPAPIRDLLDDLTLTLSGLPTNTNSDLSVTFRLRADLFSPGENVSLSIDGFPFGIWLNDDDTDDAIEDVFDGHFLDRPADSAMLRSVNDDPSPGESGWVFSGTATIPQAAFAPLIGDGELNALFDFSSGDSPTERVDDSAFPAIHPWAFPEFAEFSISYETAGAVPEPASLAVWSLLGLCAVAAGRWLP